MMNGWMYCRNIKKREKKIHFLQLKQCSQISSQSVFKLGYNKPNFKTDCSVIASISVMVILVRFIVHLEAFDSERFVSAEVINNLRLKEKLANNPGRLVNLSEMDCPPEKFRK